MQVLRLHPADWERGKAIRLRSLLSDPDAFGSRHATEVGFEEAVWRARLAREDAVTFVVALDGRDVGTIVGASGPEDPTQANVYAVWVAPEARGRGVGDLLMQAVVGWARESGYAEMRLEVADLNASAIGLYERHGFAPTGRTGTLPPPREHIREHERALDLKSAST